MAVVLNVPKILLVSAGCAAILSLAAPAAQAGFEWTPPSKAAQPTIGSVAPSASPVNPDPNLLTPDPDAAPVAPVTPVEGTALQPQDLIVPDVAAAPATTAPAGLRVEQPAPAIAPAPVSQPMLVDDAPAAGMKTISSRDVPATPAAKPVATTTPAESAKAQSYPRRQKENANWNEAEAKAKATAKTAKPEVSAATAASAPTPAPVEAPLAVTEPAPSTAPVPALGDAKVVEGFAKDISLALALSQIVPPSYAYKFQDDVNAGQKVSWQGGKPWPQVLSDMLTGTDLQVSILANTVTVEKVSAVSRGEPKPVPTAPEVTEVPVVSPKPIAEKAEPDTAPTPTKVARLSDSPADLPVPVRSVSLAKQAAEAQAAEANERRAIENRVSENKPAASAAGDKKVGVPVVDVQTSRRWEATPGKTLRETLEGWSATAGAEIEWMSPYDYPVDHAFVYEGKFDAAVDSILSLYAKEEQRPRGRLYPNLPTGPSVLTIN